MMIILDLLEFQILAAAKGMESYYGISEGKSYRQEEIYYAAHQMLQAGILQKEEDCLKVQSPLSRYLDWMQKGKCVLVIERRPGAYPRQCLYGTSSGFLCLECSTTDKDRVFLYEIRKEELSEELGNAGQLPEEKLTKDIGSYDFDCYWEQHMDGSVREMLQKSEETGTKVFWECPQAYGIFSLHDKATGELQNRMVLWELPLEYCMVLWEMGGELRFQRYEREMARKIIDSWWREET